MQHRIHSRPNRLPRPNHFASCAAVGAALLATFLAAPRSHAPRTAPFEAPDLAALVADAPTWLPVTSDGRARPVPCMSAAEEAEFRLAFVMARDPAAYRGVESGASQDGQAIVLATYDATPYRASGPGRLPDRVVRVGDGSFLTGSQRESLVAARGADGAWTYGTVDPDGTVRASGTTIMLCLRCHADAPHDGLFGLDGSR